jgi:flagellar basal body rod protein FlgG
MNVELYSGAAGMRVGQDYQQLITENLSLQSLPGYRQTLPVFTTDATMAGAGTASSGNPAAVRMNRAIDFSQGPIQPSGSPFHMAIQGQGFFEVKEADGTKSFTRNGEFDMSASGQLRTSDGAVVLGSGGSPITVDPNEASTATVAPDGTISINGAAQGKVGFAHFENPAVELKSGEYGRFVAAKSSDVESGLASGDRLVPNSLEQSNGNPVAQMANMILAVRLYEANQKSVQTADDNENQLITNLGSRPQG